MSQNVVVVVVVVAKSSLRDVINKFGMDSIILWNAILLEKRILVVGEDISEVVQVLRQSDMSLFNTDVDVDRLFGLCHSLRGIAKTGLFFDLWSWTTRLILRTLQQLVLLSLGQSVHRYLVCRIFSTF